MELTECIKALEYAKKAVRVMLDSESSLVDFHGITYWAGEVERLRKEIKAQL
jgi:ribonuclease HI